MTSRNSSDRPLDFTSRVSRAWKQPTVLLGLSAVCLLAFAPGFTSQEGPATGFAGADECHGHAGELEAGGGFLDSHSHAHGAGVGNLFGKNGQAGTAAQAGWSGIGQHNSACPGGNARDNVYSPPYEVGIDFIPLATDDSIGFHVVYSGKDNGNGTGTSLNASIYLFEEKGGGLLIFGGGYGDPNGPYTALNSAAFDVANVDAVVRQCLGKSPANTPIDFVWPHWHGDHGNDEFIHALEDAGYPVRSISFHEDDASYIYGFGWYANDLAKFIELPDGSCNTPIASIETTAGHVWFTARSGHTAGAIDLVIDVLGNVNDRFHIRGSAQGTPCPNPPSGTTDQIESHNNVVLTNLPQVVPYGCANPFGSLTAISGTPKPNQLMTFGVDDPTGSVAAGALSFLLISDSPDPAYPCGTLFGTNGTPNPVELLLNTESALALSPPIPGPSWTGPGTPAQINLRIPPDATLKGTSIYLQGYLAKPNGPVGRRLALTDGLELRVR